MLPPNGRVAPSGALPSVETASVCPLSPFRVRLPVALLLAGRHVLLVPPVSSSGLTLYHI